MSAYGGAFAVALVCVAYVAGWLRGHGRGWRSRSNRIGGRR